MRYVPSHPQAKAAIWLAKILRGAPSDLVTRVLNDSGIDRRLFVIASECEARKNLPVVGGHVDVYA